MKTLKICSFVISVFWALPVCVAASNPKISMERATEIATKKVPGTVKSSEFEHERGQDVYSFDIVDKKGAIHEVLVNAKSGKIVSNVIESAEKEAREAAEEAKKK